MPNLTQGYTVQTKLMLLISLKYLTIRGEEEEERGQGAGCRGEEERGQGAGCRGKEERLLSQYFWDKHYQQSNIGLKPLKLYQ